MKSDEQILLASLQMKVCIVCIPKIYVKLFFKYEVVGALDVDVSFQDVFISFLW
jgi:hypothetical protein